jgi:pimeloyl-ACP methyl ester carboxylesterase
VRVPDTGHFLHMEKPDEVNRILLEWLSRQGL